MDYAHMQNTVTVDTSKPNYVDKGEKKHTYPIARINSSKSHYFVLL